MEIFVTDDVNFIGGPLVKRFARDGHSDVISGNFGPFYDLGIKEYQVETRREAIRESDVCDADFVYEPLV
jgi:nucleoside-diphosphate-sugar epimerase